MVERKKGGRTTTIPQHRGISMETLIWRKETGRLQAGPEERER